MSKDFVDPVTVEKSDVERLQQIARRYNYMIRMTTRDWNRMVQECNALNMSAATYLDAKLAADAVYKRDGFTIKS